MRAISRRSFFSTALAATALGTTGACSTRSPRNDLRVLADDATAAPTAIPDIPHPPVPQPPPPAPPDFTDLRAASPTSWGTDLPGIVDTVPTIPGTRTIALTFDACGGPEGSAVDHKLLDLLREYRIPATLFLNSRWIGANTDLTRSLAEDPLFSMQNHGTRHCPLSVTGREAYGIPGTGDVDDAAREITANRDLMHQITGTAPGWFRSGTAHYDDVALTVASRLGTGVAGFTTNLDGGGTFTADQVADQLQTAPDGAICLGHMNQPTGATADGLRHAFATLDIPALRFVHLP